MAENMKGMAVRRYGETSVLEEMDFSMPTLHEEDVLIEIHAASVNPIDYKSRNGMVKILYTSPMPMILGNDCAGVISKVGTKVTQFKVGDRVYTRPPSNRTGTFAEFIAVEQRYISRMPDCLNFVEAAGIPLVGLTAYQAFYNRLKLNQGQKVLIHAGAGGLGTFAIQHAKRMGLYVATTTSEKGYELVKAMGADEIINYKIEAFDQKLHDFDAVLDTLGGSHLIKSFKIVKKGGKVLSVSGIPDRRTASEFGLGFLPMTLIMLACLNIIATAYYYGVDYEFLPMEANGQQLQYITEWIEQGQIKPVIDRTYSLSDAQQALDYVESGRAKGKVIVKVGG